MFGYIRFDRNELKLKEYRLLRAYYCGLCHRLGTVAPVLKLKLSYDMTFLSLCLACAVHEKPQFKKKWCPNHPTQKTLYAVSPSLDIAADLFLFLSVFKLEDNARDGERIRAGLAMSVLKAAYKKAINRNNALHECLKAALARFYEAERQNKDAESLAALFGEVISSLVSLFPVEDKYKPVLKTVATQLGQWVYIADAVDDFDEDQKKGNFNPLTEVPSYYAMSQAYRLAEANKAAALLPDNAFKPIIENFLTYGMQAQQNKYFSDQEEQHGN